MGDEEAGLPVGSRLRRWVLMHRRLNAPPERVFRAWADPEELARWFPERIEGGLAVGSRSVLVWSERRVWWEVIEAHPSRSFVFRWPWFPDDGLVTTVSVTIEPAGYGSRLALEDGPSRSISRARSMLGRSQSRAGARRWRCFAPTSTTAWTCDGDCSVVGHRSIAQLQVIQLTQ